MMNPVRAIAIRQEIADTFGPVNKIEITLGPRSDQPAEVDPKHVLKNILGRLPADVLADLGIHKPTGTDHTMSAYLTRRRSVKAIAALLEVLRLASEWV